MMKLVSRGANSKNSSNFIYVIYLSLLAPSKYNKECVIDWVFLLDVQYCT